MEHIRKALMAEEEVVFAYIHGGFTRRSFFRDIDVAVWIKHAEKAFKFTVHLSAKLEAELGIPVDIQVLNEAPLPFKYHVYTEGKLLLSKNDLLRTKEVNTTIRKYLDLEKLIEYAISRSNH